MSVYIGGILQEAETIAGTLTIAPDVVLRRIDPGILTVNNLQLASVTQSVIVDFGYPSGGEDFIATTHVENSKITNDCYITCSPSGRSTPDHDAEDAAVDGIHAYAANIIHGNSFDVIAFSDHGSWGRYYINVSG
jgi:hypothetical protein